MTEPASSHCECTFHSEPFGCHHEPHELPEVAPFGGPTTFHPRRKEPVLDPEAEYQSALYELRAYAKHFDNCRFVQTYTGVEAENQSCTCGFDEALEQYTALTGEI